MCSQAKATIADLPSAYSSTSASTPTTKSDLDAFLYSTGLADAVTLANRCGIDIQSAGF